MKKIILLSIIALSATAANAQWQQTTLNSGFTFCIGINGTNIFAGGFPPGDLMYVSANNGSNWSPASTGMTWYPDAIAFSDTNIFTGTNGDGVFLSTNNGATWTGVSNGLTDSSVLSLAVSGSNIFAGTGGGVFLSTNNGANWTAVNNGLTSLEIYSLGISGSNIFAGTYTGGIFLSTDNGANWTAVNTGLPSPGTYGIYSFAFNGSNIFAGTEGMGVFVSSNNGGNWSATGVITSPLAIVPALAVSGGSLFAGTLRGVFLSTNNGTNWNDVNTGLTDTGVVSLAINATTIFAGTGGGVYKRQLSEIMGIEEQGDGFISNIYPNPTSGKFTISSKDQINSIVVQNVLGEIIYAVPNLNLQTTYELDLSYIPQGIYFVKIYNEDKIHTDKIVIQ